MPLTCPRCTHDFLLIKMQTGMERIYSIFTRKRAFKCCTCGFKFRAADRRSSPRETPDADSVLVRQNG